MISTLGPECAEGTQEAVDAAWAGIKDGSLQVFDTSKFTCQPSTDGTYQVDADGHVTSCYAFDLDGDFVNDEASGEAIVDGAFQESVLRSAPYFALRILSLIHICYKADMSRFLRDMISHPSESCEEKEVVMCIKAEMENLGFDKVEVDGLGNVIGWMGEGEKIIAIDSHIDTVGVGNLNNWEADPYTVSYTHLRIDLLIVRKEA